MILAKIISTNRVNEIWYVSCQRYARLQCLHALDLDERNRKKFAGIQTALINKMYEKAGATTRRTTSFSSKHWCPIRSKFFWLGRCRKGYTTWNVGTD